jgi:hypothetical protein
MNGRPPLKFSRSLIADGIIALARRLAQSSVCTGIPTFAFRNCGPIQNYANLVISACAEFHNRSVMRLKETTMSITTSTVVIIGAGFVGSMQPATRESRCRYSAH